jgi:hypothetical protein
VVDEFLRRASEKYGPVPEAWEFGDTIDWTSETAETHLYVELPFWLMMAAGSVTVTWASVTFALEICSPWMEVFVDEVTDSRISCFHQGPWSDTYQPPQEWAALRGEEQVTWLPRRCKTVLRLSALAHTSAFRTLSDSDLPRARAEQQAYWASLAEAHVPVVNELIQRYRLASYDYFAYEVSAWDVPVWYLKHKAAGYRAVLLPYKTWDERPVAIGGIPPEARSFSFATLPELEAISSSEATPGEFDLLDARSLMERGDYTGAVRRTVTAIEAALEWALLNELEKRYPRTEARERLEGTKNDVPGRLRQWRKLAKPEITDAQVAEFEATRSIRHEIVHHGLRLSHDDRGRAQRAVDTGRWLYNRIESKPERERLREKGGLLRAVGRVALSPRFPAVVSVDGITLAPFGSASAS